MIKVNSLLLSDTKRLDNLLLNIYDNKNKFIYKNFKKYK